MDGTHGRTTFGDDPEQQLLRKQPMEFGTMAVQAGNKMQMLAMFQPSYLPEIRIWLVTGYYRLNMSEKKRCKTNRRDNVARFSGNGLW